ncbi:MAG: alpha-L-fucosidase [Bacteroidales bacterium]|nr:alpha-L-fucosidase [Bacteroidales bacterium]
MKKLTLSLILILCCLTSFAQNRNSDPNPEFRVIVETSKEAIAPGKWQPTVESLSAWECPEWFRDAKFGIWAHWGPQCEPEDGDWYARNMYIEGNGQYQYNIDARDHPSRWGFKDWIHEWKAENWDPDALIKFYKEVGARYFFTLANHHDNFDLYDSKYQSWNSVALGPEKDIVGGWAEACRKYGLRLGVSVHAAHAWVWYETSRGADTKGPLAGVPYDGVLNKEDGVGTWWEGLDPQELYEQRHPLSKNNRSWDWEEDLVTTPDQAFCDKIYNRTVQLINDYNPDIVYFDDTYLPLWPVSDAGLKILAHGYNKSAERNGGESQIVFTGKVLTDWQKKTLLWDVERGAPDAIQDLPWQTCTCIGEWHYNKHVYYEDRYKTSAQVISMLVDVVSKNGNLLLSVPLRGDGTPDPTEIRIVTQIGHWMKINSESIYDTRPWVIYGEGPATDTANPINAQGFNEGRLKYTAKDIRFNKKGDKVLYVTLLGVPEEDITVKALGSKTAQNSRKIKSITLLGSDKEVKWIQNKDNLAIACPTDIPSEEAVVYKVVLK